MVNVVGGRENNSKFKIFIIFWACMDRLFGKMRIWMPNIDFGDYLDPEFVPKLIPWRPTGDELGKSLFTISFVKKDFFRYSYQLSLTHGY